MIFFNLFNTYINKKYGNFEYLEFYGFCFGHLYYVCKIKINRWREIEIELDIYDW